MIQKTLPIRKRMRLKSYDYSQAGMYFITICTFEKRHTFGTVGLIQESTATIDKKIRKEHQTFDNVGLIQESTDPNNKIICKLSEQGKIVQEIINSLEDRFLNLKIENYVIMPNHVHLILHLQYDTKINKRERLIPESTLRPRSEISKIVGYLKMNATKKIRNGNEFMHIWQRSYHDHVIRNEQDYIKIYQYIEKNPCTWQEDCHYTTI